MNLLDQATQYAAHNHALIVLAHAAARGGHTILYMALAYLAYALAETAIIVLAVSDGLFFKIGRALFRLIVVLAIYSLFCINLLDYLEQSLQL